MSWFSSPQVPEEKKCDPDPVFTVVHQVDAVCALVADLMRLHDAVTQLKEVFNPGLLTVDQRETLREVFLATEELFGPDVEDDTDEDEQPVVVPHATTADAVPITNVVPITSVVPTAAAILTRSVRK
jgi:hypothetical protein